MKKIASPNISATAIAAIAMITGSGLPVYGADARASVNHVMATAITNTEKTPSTFAEAKRLQWSPLSCVRKRDEWLFDLAGSPAGQCEFERRVKEYAEKKQLPMPICFYPGKKEVPSELSRILAFNITLIGEQAKGRRLPIYYLDSQMGSDHEERPFPRLACERGFEVDRTTSPLDRAIGGTLPSRSTLGRMILYSRERPPKMPICPAN